MTTQIQSSPRQPPQPPNFHPHNPCPISASLLPTPPSPYTPGAIIHIFLTPIIVAILPNNKPQRSFTSPYCQFMAWIKSVLCFRLIPRLLWRIILPSRCLRRALLKSLHSMDINFPNPLHTISHTPPSPCD